MHAFISNGDLVSVGGYKKINNRKKKTYNLHPVFDELKIGPRS